MTTTMHSRQFRKLSGRAIRLGVRIDATPKGCERYRRLCRNARRTFTLIGYEVSGLKRETHRWLP
jgi:hypothetical protein